MRVDLRQWQAFVTVAECGNYREAASRLHCTQPALSKQIQTLESQLGTSLLHRGRHGAEPTPQGQRLLRQAKALLAHASSFGQEARAVAAGLAGRLNIGFGLSSFELAPAWVADFAATHPEVRLHLQDQPSAMQEAQLLSGQLQVGFMRRPENGALAWQPLLSDRLVLAVPEKSWQGEGSDAVAQALCQAPLLQMVGRRCPGLSSQIARFLGARQLVGVIQEAEDIQTLVALVAAGLGNAILPASTAFIAGRGVRLCPLEGEHTQWEIGIGWHPDLEDPLTHRFVDRVLAG